VPSISVLRQRAVQTFRLGGSCLLSGRSSRGVADYAVSPPHLLTFLPFDEFLAVAYVQAFAQLGIVCADVTSVNAVYTAVVIC
jgi:hypothetical protein